MRSHRQSISCVSIRLKHTVMVSHTEKWSSRLAQCVFGRVCWRQRAIMRLIQSALHMRAFSHSDVGQAANMLLLHPKNCIRMFVWFQVCNDPIWFPNSGIVFDTIKVEEDTFSRRVEPIDYINMRIFTTWLTIWRAYCRWEWVQR